MAKRRDFGTVRKLPSGKFQATYIGPDHQRHKAHTTFDTKGAATSYLGRVKADIDREAWVSPEEKAQREAETQRLADEKAQLEAEALERDMTLTAFTQLWLTAKASGKTVSGRGAREVKTSTISTYRSRLEHDVLPVLGDLRMSELNDKNVGKLLDDLALQPSKVNPQGRGNGVALPVGRTLKALLSDAEREGYIASLPHMYLPANKPVRARREDSDVATQEQVKALHEAMPEQWRIAVLLAAYCQTRLGETLGLQRRDFEHLDDSTRALVKVRRQLNTKTGKLTDDGDVKSTSGERNLFIPSGILPTLRDHMDSHVEEHPNALILRSLTPSKRSKGEIASSSVFDRTWREVRDSLNMEGFRFHDLRHTGLTLYAQQGATLKELMYRGGHSDHKVVMRYQHSTQDRQLKLVQLMSNEMPQF
ncbi:site-specific integrase [Nesterenkonia sp. LB17]|uniref:tyrosine-type recombinase/integrase n=1 Tax=Nesterenkonia sp. LB17 TaxID=2901230 RepID=UPI001F4CD282|nr:site-specific integrase [Nesterenkonia sp. LB17]MCH8564733.1 site-specific integrase [Nesterenkonia sp. LB17]